jgi:GAF domain-containing protein/CheY-like chemotaxis protein
MARESGSVVTARRVRALIVCTAGLCSGVFAQSRLSLLDVGTRTNTDYSPAYLNQKVTIRGTVNAHLFQFPGYSVLCLQDDRSGSALQVSWDSNMLADFHAGDDLEATGTVSRLAGMVTVVPDVVTKVGQRSPPLAADVPLESLMDFRYLGKLVRTEGIVREVGESSAGSFLTLGVPVGKYRIFLPHKGGQNPADLDGYAVGDQVRLTGVAFQYCTRPPFNSSFELLVEKPADIQLIGRSQSLSPVVVVSGAGLALLIAFLLWHREHRMRNQRQRVRRTYQLGEEILSASSPEKILAHLSTALPSILSVSRVRLHVFNRAAKTLDTIAGESGAPVSISLSSPPGGTQAGAVACFHYRTLLVIPDIDRSPFPMGGQTADTPKSLLFVPMLAQGEVVGVLELDQDDRVRDFTADEQELAQHMGNQAAVAVRLLEQRSVQEQLFRTEKLAAVGRLISGVVNELQTPLASISDLARRLLEKSHSGIAEREISTIAVEAQKAAAMVSRLVSFAAAEQGEARPVSVSALLKNLIEFREGDWKASGIKVRDLTTRDPQLVLGSQGQLEQVFLNLLVHAEQSLTDVSPKVITIRSSVLAKRLLVEIAFNAPPQSRKPEDTAAVLGVTRSVIAGHGGEVRLIEKANSEPRFEVELPLTVRDRASAAQAGSRPAYESSRSMTGLVIEPDETAQRQLLSLLSTRGFRVVPVADADTGLELAHRMRFDAAFCSVRAPGLNWVELSERMHSRVGGFVLLADGYDAELAADFEGDSRFVLPKPVQERELDRILRSLESSASSMKHGAA